MIVALLSQMDKDPMFTITVEILTTMQTALSLLTPMVTLAVIMLETHTGVAATTLMFSILTCAVPVVEVNPLMAVTVTVTMTAILVVTLAVTVKVTLVVTVKVTLAVMVTVTTVPLTKK